MVWNLDWERLADTAEIEFVGKVVDVRYPCDCPKCAKGKERLKEMGRERTTQQLHIVVAPLNRNWRLQHVFIDMSTTSKKSRRGVLAHACKVLGIETSNFEEFRNDITKRIFYFRKMTVANYLQNVAGLKITDREAKQLNLDAQIIVPVKVLPVEALELEGLSKDTVKEKVAMFKRVWKLILEGKSDDEAYETVFGEMAEELENELSEEEEKEPKKQDKAEAKKKKKNVEEESEEEEEEEEKEEESKEEKEEEEEEEEFI